MYVSGLVSLLNERIETLTFFPEIINGSVLVDLMNFIYCHASAIALQDRVSSICKMAGSSLTVKIRKLIIVIIIINLKI